MTWVIDAEALPGRGLMCRQKTIRSWRMTQSLFKAIVPAVENGKPRLISGAFRAKVETAGIEPASAVA